MMNIERIVVGQLETNCYILHNNKRETVIIDPGGDSQNIIDKINKLMLNPLSIILTHGHYDHILAVPEIKNEYGIPIYAHRAENPMLENPNLNFSSITGTPISISAENIESSTLKSMFDADLMHLPGHSPGSIGIVVNNYFISGDTVFAGGNIGRIDIPGGSSKQLSESIELILQLPDNLILLPGHGGRSIVGHEKKFWRQILKLLKDGLL